MRTLALLLLSLLLGSCASTGAASGHDHTFAFLRLGPRRAEYGSDKMNELMRGHMANIGRLAEQRELYLAGPMGQGNPEPELRGIFVLATGDVARARKLCQSDPSIAAGVLEPEIVPMRTDADLADVLARGLEFEERRKLDPSIPMTAGMSTYVMLLADDGVRAARELRTVRSTGAIVLTAIFGGAREGQVLFVLDARDLAAAEAMLAPVRAELGPHKLLPWFGTIELRTAAESL